MKLLCMTGGYLPSVGGMQYSNHETMIGLVENGIEITQFVLMLKAIKFLIKHFLLK